MSIGLFLVSWFAIGFLVALALGKILRESNYLGDEDLLGDVDLHLAEPAGVSVKLLRPSDRKATRRPRPAALTREHSDTKRAAG
ncbi:MAG: hypothetical protein ACE5H7_07165 [Acidiferrobacterales bacterium]